MHGLAVFCKRLGGNGRQAGKQYLSAFGLQVVGHGGPRNSVLSAPLRKHARHTLEGAAVQHRFRLDVLQHVADQCGVAMSAPGTGFCGNRRSVPPDPGLGLMLGMMGLPRRCLNPSTEPDFLRKGR